MSRVNAAFERITGLKREDTLGRTSIEVGVWHDPQAREALVQAFQTTGSLNEYFILINGRGGQVREALVNAATFEARGERYMIALLRDVTDARAAERALQESESRFSSLFDQSPLPMCYSSDSDGFATTQWNRAWFAASGSIRLRRRASRGPSWVSGCTRRIVKNCCTSRCRVMTWPT